LVVAQILTQVIGLHFRIVPSLRDSLALLTLPSAEAEADVSQPVSPLRG